MKLPIPLHPQLRYSEQLS